MALEDLLDHTCNIFHIVDDGKSPGFGLPAGSDFIYPAEPDLSGVSCHFGVHNSSIQIIQREPQTGMEGKNRLTVPPGTDLRLNDKVVNAKTLDEYTAELPRNIRGHHIVAALRRADGQKPL